MDLENDNWTAAIFGKTISFFFFFGKVVFDDITHYEIQQVQTNKSPYEHTKNIGPESANIWPETTTTKLGVNQALLLPEGGHNLYHFAATKNSSGETSSGFQVPNGFIWCSLVEDFDDFWRSRRIHQ